MRLLSIGVLGSPLPLNELATGALLRNFITGCEMKYNSRYLKPAILIAVALAVAAVTAMRERANDELAKTGAILCTAFMSVYADTCYSLK